MYGINVVNFSPFLSYAMFWWGNQIFAITVTKPRHVKTFGLWDFLLKKVLLQDFTLIVGSDALMLFVTKDSTFSSLFSGIRCLYSS